MAKIPEFKFDFEAVKGMEFTEAFTTLFKQMEVHYNKHIKPAPLILGDIRISAPVEGPAPVNAVSTTVLDPPKKRPLGIDSETVTADTRQLADFSIRESADGTRKMLIGKDKDGNAINDLLLPGYDVEPYGPVVSGEQGRYNLKITR